MREPGRSAGVLPDVRPRDELEGQLLDRHPHGDATEPELIRDETSPLDVAPGVHGVVIRGLSLEVSCDEEQELLTERHAYNYTIPRVFF
jgi:hypothetical protein